MKEQWKKEIAFPRNKHNENKGAGRTTTQNKDLRNMPFPNSKMLFPNSAHRAAPWLKGACVGGAAFRFPSGLAAAEAAIPLTVPFPVLPDRIPPGAPCPWPVDSGIRPASAALPSSRREVGQLVSNVPMELPSRAVTEQGVAG